MNTEKEYITLLQDIKTQIQQSQVKTVMAANAQMLWAYCYIGNLILVQQEKAGWGKHIINKLSQDIQKEFPNIKGFSPRNLSYMRQFALLYPLEIIQQATHLQNEIISGKNIHSLFINNKQISDNQGSIILQPPVAKLQEDLFVQQVIHTKS